MESKEKIEACEMKKHDGNLLFRAGKFWRASKKYEKARDIAFKLNIDKKLILLLISSKTETFDELQNTGCKVRRV